MFQVNFVNDLSVSGVRQEMHNQTVPPVLPSGIPGHREGLVHAGRPSDCRSNNAG